MRANRSRRSLKRGENYQKHTKHMIFESNFLEYQVNIVLFIKYLQNRFALMLFFNERRDRFALFDLFQRSPSVIRSQTIFLNDRRERFDHGWSFVKIKMVKRSKIERSKDRILNPALSTVVSPLCYRAIVSRDILCILWTYCVGSHHYLGYIFYYCGLLIVGHSVICVESPPSSPPSLLYDTTVQ